MARKGLFKEIPSPDDELLQRLQKNIKDVVETLTADDDILRVPVTVMVVTGAIPAGKSVVVFTGAANQKLTLPLANSQGAAVSSVSLVVNTSGNALTVIPAASNTINGILSLTVAPGVAVLLTSDGQTKWIAILGPGGAGGGGGGTGPQGITGPPGFAMDGEDGADGMAIPGRTGNTGATGGVGPQGITGPPGFGQDADEPEGPWLVPGPAGVAGINGTPGINASPMFAVDGEDGADGMPVPGPAGNSGAQGAQGLTGPPGFAFDGEDGADGMHIPGVPGLQGAQGIGGPPGFAVDGEDGADGMSIPGAPGLQGAQGLTGPPGFAVDGEDGADGMPIPGTPGLQGAQGITGPPGFALDGEDGVDAWLPGLQGVQGATGPQGVQGTVGPPGWPVEPDQPDDPVVIRGAQGTQGGVGAQGITGPPGFAVDGEDGQNAWPSVGQLNSNQALQANIRGLRIFGHSYTDTTQAATGGASAVISNNYLFPYIAAGQLQLPASTVINHGINGSRMAQVNGATGWVMILNALKDVKAAIDWPFVRSGECVMLCQGINDLGNNTVANQSKIVADCGRSVKTIISMHRASALFLASTAAQWTFGANFSLATAAGENDFTMGTARKASVVDAAGTSTATFTIPTGYKGEPICFSLVALTGGSLVVTWGGTISGTSSIVGRTDTLSGLTVDTNGAYPVRFTSAANGLSAANAGQTITVRITTVAASTFYIDGCWIEAKKPSPFILCNVPRLACRTYAWEFGDAVLASGSIAITSAVAAQFLAATDTGQGITVTDGGGGLQANTTIASVTNLTTAVLSLTANANRPVTAPAKVSLVRIINGYSSYATNTDFANATPASHAAADAEIDALNTEYVARVAEFGSMVQICDLNTAFGLGDQTPLVSQYSRFLPDGLHPNEVGNEYGANALVKAIYALTPEDTDNVGTVEVSGGGSYLIGQRNRMMNSGQLFTPEFSAISGTPYTAVAGHMFALPFEVTAPTMNLGAWWVEQTNAPVTSGSSVRVGIYRDHSALGVPGTLWTEATGSAFALGTTAGMKNIATSVNRAFHTGWYWVVFKIDALGTTASQLRAFLGPVNGLPQWTVSGGATFPTAWLVTGVAAGALPRIFPTGGSFISTQAPIVGQVLTRL